ncbi:AIPR family protein [Amylibacter sp.]|nr:AIPR family protein [Amylibacter sp.]
MSLEKILQNRDEILQSSKDEDGFISSQGVINEFLQYMTDSKLLDSEEISEVSKRGLLDGYSINESGERLQLFVVDENSLAESLSEEEIFFSERSKFVKIFDNTSKYILRAFKGLEIENSQDSDPAKVLMTFLSENDAKVKFDVVEIFLISLTATVVRQIDGLHPQDIYFSEDKFPIKYVDKGENSEKELFIVKKLINLNFYTNIEERRGLAEPLVVNFKKSFNYTIPVLKAAEESYFESYLCVFEAQVLYDLYKLHSSRLLEENVRSFLQFGGVNKGLRNTIKESPEKFIAFNNGITITATKAIVKSEKKNLVLEELTDLQIVNGGQTTASIYFSKKDGADISNVKVVAKINVIKSEKSSDLDDLISNISKFSNTQTKVNDADLSSKNPQLRKIKQLSEVVASPGNNLWFFERSRGEYKTQRRKHGTRTAGFDRNYPKIRLITKEQLAKVYMAWGDTPWFVKKAGTPFFRSFIETLSPNEEDKTHLEIDRDFYENIISKVIMWRSLEGIYGAGKKAIGQLRSAAVPYSLAVLFLYTDGHANRANFNFDRIWRREYLEDDLKEFFKLLLSLMNDLIKKYAKSEDFAEYAKKIDLWDSIKNCEEIEEFFKTKSAIKIIEKYTYTK